MPLASLDSDRRCSCLDAGKRGASNILRGITLGLPLIVALAATPLLAAAAAEPPPDRLAATIAALTAPELAGRGAGTPEERLAADLIAGWFESAGLEPALAGGWTQIVPLPPAHGEATSVNVVGMLPGRGDLADRWVVAGAHLDHLGRVDPAAGGVPGPGEYYPGAGDNAAGIAALLHVAGELAAAATARTNDIAGEERPRRSVLFCAFGAEEIGLLGSAHLVASAGSVGGPPVPLDRIEAMVNLDAIGRLGDRPLNVAGVETCPDFPALLAAAAGETPLAGQDAGRFGSDHLSFLAHGIPVLFLFTGGYPEMNSPADSLSAIDLAGLATVAAVAAQLVDGLATHPDPLLFVPSPPPTPVVVDGDRRTWFGSVPDFAAIAGDGYRIGGLNTGGPAERAGLRVGDRLLSLGGQAVSDLATFTAALRRHAPGEVVAVEVEREGRLLSFLVDLGDRADRVP